jgi:hypothetical protein
MKFSATTIAMALSLSKVFKLAFAETSAGAKTSSTSWEGEIGYNLFTDKNCADSLLPNTNSTAPYTQVVSSLSLGNNTLCQTTTLATSVVGNMPIYTLKMTIKCDTAGTGLEGYEDYFLTSYIDCFDNNCRNCTDIIGDNTLEPKTNFPYTPYSCGLSKIINLTTGEETPETFYFQYYASPEVMDAYNEVYATTCIGDYVKSSSSSSTPNDTEAASTNETEGMLSDGSGANTGEEGGSSVASITWGVSSFVVLATAGLSTILFE